MDLVLIILLGASVAINIVQRVTYNWLKQRHVAIKEINETLERKLYEKDKTS